ncbi:MAG: hypothetical protein SFZ23_10980 [Planctomycetota bacterium]|nr:hypothetical protein [Planctomycetota bacterium]
MPLASPVIVVPGITATYLRDEYTIPPDKIWTVRTFEWERGTPHPDDTSLEAIEPARVVRDQIYEICYVELIEELRHNLRSRVDLAVPVFPFGYDWRKPLKETEAELEQFIDEVIRRTCLMRHYVADGYPDDPKVNLVGHSMGGLIIAGCLERLAKSRGKKTRVGKVATLASPFQGSFEAIIKVATGTANLGASEPSSRERETARMTPAVYHLLPSFQEGSTFAQGLPQSYFTPDVWQPSVLATLTEFVRLHAVSTRDRAQQAAELFTGMLKGAKEHRDRIDALKLSDAGLKPEDWLCVVGVDSTTRIRFEISLNRGKPEFTLSGKDRCNHWADGKSDAERRQTGDGTVPYCGAVPKFLKEENLVCVTPDDFGYWEVQDRATSALAGFHGILPNMDMLHRLIVRHFMNRPDHHGNTWGRPAPGVAPEAWEPPLKLMNKAAT